MEQITVHCGDSYVLVEPVVPDELIKLLSYWHRSLEIDPATHKRIAKGSTRNLFTLAQEIGLDGVLAHRLITLPGFAKTILRELVELGYSPTIVDERTPRPKYSMAAGLVGLRDYQLECAYTAIWSGGGIISAPTGWGKTHLIAAIIRAHDPEELCFRNTSLTVVVTPGVDLAKKNYRALQEQLPGRIVGLVCTGVKRFSEDVQVVTPESLDHIDLKNAGLLFYDEVHTLSYSRAESVMRAAKALRYGFSATPSGRFDGADKVIEGVVGPVIYRRTYQEAVVDGAVVPLRVYWLHCPEVAGWRHFSTHDANYRNGIWRNGRLHELVGQIWQRIPDELQALGMVDKLEHLNLLLPFLGGVAYAHGQTGQEYLTSKRFTNLCAVSYEDRNRIYAALADGSLKRVVSTGIYRQGVDFPQLTVLLNLAGMKSEIIAGQLPGRTSRLSDGKTYGIIVDFWHGWDTYAKGTRNLAGTLLRDDMNREQVYRSLGFQQVWVESLDQLEFGTLRQKFTE